MLSVVLQLMAVLVFRPGGYLGVLGDFADYRLMLSFTNQGYLPLVDYWMEYPPVFPWLMLGLYRLSLLIPAWTTPGTWFYLLLSLVLVAANAGSLALVYGIGRRLWGQRRALQMSWIYALLLIPLLSIFVGFDGLALLFLLWAVLLTLDRRPIGSGVAAGLGFMTKLVPIAAVPAALQHMPRAGQQRVKHLLAAGLTALLVALPFVIAAPQFLLQSLLSPVKRSTWESVWALIDGYYSYGVAGGWDRFDPAMAGAAQHPTRLPWLAITIAFGLFYLWLWTRRIDWQQPRRVVAFTALTQNLLTLYFKGYSPQFLVMLLPFILLLIPGWRGVLYALLLSAINLVEHPVYFLILPDQHWLLAGTVLLRTLILGVLSLEYAAQVFGWRVGRRWWRRTALGVLTVVAVAGAIGGVAGFRAYWTTRYEVDPQHDAMQILLDQATATAGRGSRPVVVDDQEVYEHVYPYLHAHFDVRVVEVRSYLPPWEPLLAEAADAAEGELWIYAAADSPLHDWAAGRFPPLARYELDGRVLTGWDVP
ncbi:MAG: hypothetical protein P8129_13015 [Anaerolineae bacterium]